MGPMLAHMPAFVEQGVMRRFAAHPSFGKS